jgi:hypothetical protein
MKEVTIKLKRFLKSKFLDNTNKKNNKGARTFPQFKFSENSKPFITDLFKRMNESQIMIGSMKMDTYHIKDHKLIPRSNDHDYLPECIKTEIDKMDKNAYTYRFHLLNKEYQVAFIYPINKNYTEHIFHQRIHKIMMWLYIANKFASPKCSQKMNIFIYFTDLKKKLPTQHKTIQPEHANTAYTTSCQTTTEINLFREEEWFKVLIHETFHNLGLDFSEMTENHSKNAVLSIFHVNSDVNLFETYCEMWAEIMNVLFIVYLTNNTKNMDTLIIKTENLLSYERIFSLFQCVKVLHFYGLTYNEIYENTSNNHISRTHKFREKDTNVLSYYIIKCILMFFTNEFIEWCMSNNKNSLDFYKTTDSIQSYCDLVQTYYKNPDFLNCISVIERWFKQKTNTRFFNHCNSPNNKNKTRKQCDIMNTMRMSVFES